MHLQKSLRLLNKFVDDFCRGLHALDPINGLTRPVRHGLNRSCNAGMDHKRTETSDFEGFASQTMNTLADYRLRKGERSFDR